ncbi:TrkH family potassium uptake protein [Desulfomonile tiedjei]|uniref:Trk-type K+ transport system, membrane component n=1 Tax=Desulfomonile tiedjei (strain ATCC 49306 / DSM 6799 / DCB-1) TaxID=706587 RepID=I4C3U0_DESTA|nr:potassium transporter TrkG [Desulfomonile tiedjei]AFM24231.1 Trk-type K+ transport system, membrane component [Desulfomonile tiedjei DSM 6799]
MAFFSKMNNPFLRFLGSPQTILVGSFAGVILIGALFLMLPWAQTQNKIGFVDALFTATSAVCVTGLIVVDTATDYTFFGQAVILFLIQIGGLGVMTFASLAFQILGRRLSLQTQAVVHDSFFQQDVGAEFKRTFATILLLTFGIEALGAFFLFIRFIPNMDFGEALWSSVFHSISAFCNAGFSIRSDSLIGLRHDFVVLFVIMALIVLGGLGYMVLHELWIAGGRRFGFFPVMRYRERRFSFHSRVVMYVTSILLVGGTFMLMASGLTPEETTWYDKGMNAVFQSVTSRTAGFNTVDIGLLPSGSLFILIVLMFVGGSPGSCAGGIKTTSVAIWLARLRSGVYGDTDVHLMDRRLSQELVGRTDLLIAVATVWNVIGILLLYQTETHLRVDSLHLFFEQISAFGTVGLSTGVTPNLSIAGKLWISATMFMGRLGPLTITLWMFPRSPVQVSYPKGRVMIG